MFIYNTSDRENCSEVNEKRILSFHKLHHYTTQAINPGIRMVNIIPRGMHKIIKATYVISILSDEIFSQEHISSIQKPINIANT